MTESPKNTMQTSHGKENDNIGVCEVENIEDSYEGQQVKGYETKANQKNVKEHNSNGSSCDNKGFVRDENKKSGLEIVDKSTVSKDSDIVNMKEFSSAQCVFSAMNIIYLFWFACLHVTIMFFLAAFNMRATNIANGDLDKGRSLYIYLFYFIFFSNKVFQTLALDRRPSGVSTSLNDSKKLDRDN